MTTILNNYFYSVGSGEDSAILDFEDAIDGNGASECELVEQIMRKFGMSEFPTKPTHTYMSLLSGSFISANSSGKGFIEAEKI